MFPPVIGGRSAKHPIPATRNGIFGGRESDVPAHANPDDVSAQTDPIGAPRLMVNA
jgi:hypothetical protein